MFLRSCLACVRHTSFFPLLPLSVEKVLQHPHAITIFEDFVYWTDRYINRVMRAHKWHGENQTVMLFNLPQPMGLATVHPARQPAGNQPSKLFLFLWLLWKPLNQLSTLGVGENHCLRSPCTHICLLSAVGPAYYSCACPSGWMLAADQITCTRGLHPAKSREVLFMWFIGMQITADTE